MGRRRRQRRTRAAIANRLREDRVARIAAVVGVVSTVLAIAITGSELWARIFPAPEPTSPNVEILVDRSAAMGETLAGSTTRQQAAMGEIADVMRWAASHNLALRAFGGPCDRGSERLVDFATDNAERIPKALADTEPSGNADIVRAVSDAIADFADRERFPADVVKRIVVVTGGHSCPGDLQRGLRDLLSTVGTASGLQLDFRFVGLAVRDEDREELTEIAAELGGDAVFAEDEEQLARALKDFVADEPMLAAMTAVRELVDASVDDLNHFADATFDDPDAAGAQASLRRARAAVERTDESFGRLAERHAREDFRELHRLAARNRDNQRHALEVAARYVDLARRAPGTREAEVERAAREWDVLVDTYNDVNSAMDAIMEQIAR
jgi:hypothetical protein